MAAPKGNKNAEKHGAYKRIVPKDVSIDDLIGLLGGLTDDIVKYAEEQLNAENADGAAILQAFSIIAQTTSRIGRLMLVKQALQQPNHLGWLDEALNLVDEEVKNAINVTRHTYA